MIEYINYLKKECGKTTASFSAPVEVFLPDVNALLISAFAYDLTKTKQLFSFETYST